MDRSDEPLGPDEAEVAALLRELDHPVQRPDVHVVIAAGRRGRWHIARPIAAGIALCIATAAAAMPGSPIRQALVRMFHPAHGNAPVVAPLRPDTQRAVASTGISLAPGAAVDVRFREWQASGQLRVAFTDGAQLSLVPQGGAPAFAVSRDKVAIDNRGSAASYALEVPRRARLVRVYVGSTILLDMASGVVTSPAHPDSTGSYTIDLVGPPASRTRSP